MSLPALLPLFPASCVTITATCQPPRFSTLQRPPLQVLICSPCFYPPPSLGGTVMCSGPLTLAPAPSLRRFSPGRTSRQPFPALCDTIVSPVGSLRICLPRRYCLTPFYPFPPLHAYVAFPVVCPFLSLSLLRAPYRAKLAGFVQKGQLRLFSSLTWLARAVSPLLRGSHTLQVIFFPI